MDLQGRLRVLAAWLHGNGAPTAAEDVSAAADALTAKPIAVVGDTLADVRRRLFVETLRHHQGDKTATARTLGLSVKTVYNYVAIYRAAGLLS